MTDEKLQIYNTRIVQATKKDLVIITYELMKENLYEAIEYIEQDTQDKLKQKINRCSKLLRTLIDSLDMNYELSKDLLEIYIFISKELTLVTLSKDKEVLESIIKIVDNLLQGWTSMEIQDEQPAVMENVQQIYAGLTYGKENLNEVVMSGGSNRGLRA